MRVNVSIQARHPQANAPNALSTVKGRPIRTGKTKTVMNVAYISAISKRLSRKFLSQTDSSGVPNSTLGFLREGGPSAHHTPIPRRGPSSHSSHPTLSEPFILRV